MKWWNQKKRSLGQYNFEGGFLQITLWGAIETTDALDMVDTLVALKRKEIADRNEYSNTSGKNNQKDVISGDEKR